MKEGKIREKIQNCAQKRRGKNFTFDRNMDLSRVHPRKIFSNKFISYDFENKSSCAIVASSGSLLNCEKGEEIDSHDVVVRFNTSPTVGYEKYVGTITDFRFINGMLMKGANQDFNETDANWIRNLKNENVVLTRTTNKAYENAVLDLVNRNDLYFYSQFTYDYLRDFSNSISIKDSMLSIGMSATMILLKLFDVINLYGFGFHNEDLSNRHYYEKFSTKRGDGNHDWETEEEVIFEMHHLGYINLRDVYY